MGRPRSDIPKVVWHLQIPSSLAAIVENEFIDPKTMKPSYGKRSELMVALLERWAREHGIFSRTPTMHLPLPPNGV